MLAPYGLRSLSKQDPDYNNAAIIVPYSNWQGPDLDQRELSELHFAQTVRLR